MKHAVCGGWIEIHTDPKNTAYVVISGAKKRDTGEDKDVEGEIKIRTAQERERLESDPFAALDEKVEDRRQALSQKGRVDDLKKLRDRDWSDPYEGSKKLRKFFRAERNIRHKNAAATEDLKDRMGLNIELLDEAEEDRQRVKFIDFAQPDPDTLVSRAQTRPLFSSSTSSKTKGLKQDVKPPLPNKPPAAKSHSRKPLTEAAKSKERLHRELRANTRAVLDPFLIGDGDWGGPSGGNGGGGDGKRFLVSKRKRAGSDGGFKEVDALGEERDGGVVGGTMSEQAAEVPENKEVVGSVGAVALGLADYDSD
jgi:coiled-coil domain-containing protein 130